MRYLLPIIVAITLGSTADACSVQHSFSSVTIGPLSHTPIFVPK